MAAHGGVADHEAARGSPVRFAPHQQRQRSVLAEAQLSLDEVVKVVAPALQAVSIALTAGFAIAGLNAWRRQLVGKRKIEVAEEALVATYKVRDAFTYFRSSGAFTTEGRSRPDRDSEPESLKSIKDAYTVPLERLQATSDAFAQFSKAAILCEAYFGPSTAKPFHDVLRARNRVIVSARMLLSTAGPRYERTEPNLRERWEADIWASQEEGSDAVAEAVSRGVEEIEALCRPQLGGRRDGLWQRWRRRGTPRKPPSISH